MPPLKSWATLRSETSERRRLRSHALNQKILSRFVLVSSPLLITDSIAVSLAKALVPTAE